MARPPDWPNAGSIDNFLRGLHGRHDAAEQIEAALCIKCTKVSFGIVAWDGLVDIDDDIAPRLAIDTLDVNVHDEGARQGVNLSDHLIFQALKAAPKVDWKRLG